MNCTEVVYYAAIYRTIISVRHSHSLARGNCAQNENGAGCAASFGHRISVRRHSAGVFNFFVSGAKKTLSIVYELQLLPVLCPCTFSQRVFAEIRTFSNEFTGVLHVFLWMSLLRETFCTAFQEIACRWHNPGKGELCSERKVSVWIYRTEKGFARETTHSPQIQKITSQGLFVALWCSFALYCCFYSYLSIH